MNGSAKYLNGKKILRIFFLAVLAILILTGLFLLLIRVGAFGRLPSYAELRQIQNPVATEIYSADGVLMGKYYIQNREYLTPEEVTPVIRDALVAIEDARFYHHNGIDFRSLGRVFTKSLLMGKRRSGGGSTITQQLAKNLYPRKSHGPLTMPVNKVREMMVARRMEKIYSKDEILELYLSTVPFGENAFGIKSGATLFFNKTPEDLRQEEAALLIGMLKATDFYNPMKHYDRALSRRNLVLKQMVQYDYLDARSGDSLQLLPLTLNYNPLPHYAGIAPYFREHLRQEFESWSRTRLQDNGESFDIYTDGLKIYTTIDSRLQRYAEQAVRSHMASLQELFDKQWQHRNLWAGIENEQFFINSDRPYSPELLDDEPRSMQVFTWNGAEERKYNTMDSLKHYLSLLQTGFLAMDVHKGEIKAWVGGIDYQYFKYDHVKAKRQAGSTFKPLVYLAALENGMKPCDYFPNDSVVYTEFENWTPRNADRSYGGYYSMKGALVHSVNTISVHVMMQTGIDSVVAMAGRLGIESELPVVPSLALGSANVSLLEMVGAYQAIVNKGVAVEPVMILRITDRNGRLLFEQGDRVEERQVLSEENAEIMTEILRNVVDHGTAGGLRSIFGIEADVAGKTGTTQNYTDGWFIGFTPDLIAGVWVGGDLQNVRFMTMDYGQGAFTALPIWARFMNDVFRDEESGYPVDMTFEISDSILESMDCEDFAERKPFEFKPVKVIREKRLLKRFLRRDRR